jgi:hypothetical protein
LIEIGHSVHSVPGTGIRDGGTPSPYSQTILKNLRLLEETSKAAAKAIAHGHKGALIKPPDCQEW